MNSDILTWSVGGITITSVPESSTPTSPKFMFKGFDRTAVLALAEKATWLQPHFVDENGYLLQKIHCCVIDTGDYKIAVDTCVGNDKQRGNPLWHESQGPFLEDLLDAGYAPETITHVVCTHLHVDHVGWNTRLVDGEWIPTFPNAQYIFVKEEFDHWSVTEDLFGDSVFEDSVAPITNAGLAELVSHDFELCPGVSFQSTPGHTPGHVSVVIQDLGKRAIITGDMTHSPIQIANPELSSSFDTDPDLARQSRYDAFLDWADGETLVIGTHFGSPTAGILQRNGDSYSLEVNE
jgi:glyoxylase-like metal-dependent hydrolase (beta-lactamase superfamily II)